MKQKNNERISDSFFIFVIGLLIVCVGWSKWKQPFFNFYFEHRIPIAVVLTSLLSGTYIWLRNTLLKRIDAANFEKEIVSGKEEDSVFAGRSKDNGREVYIRQSFRRMHTQVVGTTNAGKTESVILPWAVDDIKKGRGLLIIDGKSDRSLLDKLYGYAARYKRTDDVRILSLCNVPMSHTFNPLADGSPLEVAERVFSAFEFENEYYKDLQFEAFLQTLLIFQAANIKPTCLRIVQALTRPRHLKRLADLSGKTPLMDWVRAFMSLSAEDREKRTSGLVTKLQLFSVDETALVFNSDNSDINLEEALAAGHIIYCQLPVLKIPNLGKATGKLILQCLQSAISSRHLGSGDEKPFFSVYLDDFTEYLTPNFVSLLNKSRSANVAIVFAHQALGDLAALGDAVKNTILTNSNLKVFMRTNEPGSAEYFSGVIGTTLGVKVTERQKANLLGSTKTGDGSIRQTEEFKFHPNLFKQTLGVGEAVVVLPHPRGSAAVHLKFRKLPDLDAPAIADVFKVVPTGLPALDEESKTAIGNKKLAALKDSQTSTDQRKETA